MSDRVLPAFQAPRSQARPPRMATETEMPQALNQKGASRSARTWADSTGTSAFNQGVSERRVEVAIFTNAAARMVGGK